MKPTVLMFLSLALAGCGGGGGGGSGTLSVPVDSLTFLANGVSAATPPPQLISGSVTGVSSGTLYILAVGSGPAIDGISDVTIYSDTSGEALVYVPSPASLGIGTHTGQIVVRACLNNPNCTGGNLAGSPQTVDVTYHVAGLRSAAAGIDYTIDNFSTAADQVQATTITAFPSQGWTASDDANWLAVTAAGASGATLGATMLGSVVDIMPNGTYTASITVTPGTAGQALVIPVTLTIGRTQVNHVSPYVAYSGTSDEVIIRGEAFGQVVIDDVLFGSTPAESFSVVSATEIRATYPASLAVGQYPVRLQSATANPREYATLVVVDPPAFAPAVLAYPDGASNAPNAIVYDAERAALGVSVWSDTAAFVHFQSNGTTWQPATSRSLLNSFGLALTADGREWIVGNGKSVIHMRATDRVTVATVLSPLFPSGSQNLAEFATASDGTIAMFGDLYYNCGATLLLYDARQRTFRDPGHSACRGAIGASGDGSRLIIPDQFPDISSDDVHSLDTVTGQTTPTGIHLLTGARPALDRAGTRIVLRKNRVYDGSYNHLGDLAATTEAVVLSPDGTQAHAWDSSGQLLTYDLAAAPVGGVFPLAGPGISLAGNPGNAPMLYGDATAVMTLTPDGRTVFIAGSEAVIVQPVP